MIKSERSIRKRAFAGQRVFVVAIGFFDKESW
jgi:hypothetical protein